MKHRTAKTVEAIARVEDASTPPERTPPLNRRQRRVLGAKLRKMLRRGKP